MFHRSLSSVLLGTALSLGVAGTVAAAPAHYVPLNDSPNGTYRIDPQHSNVFFTLGHVGITQFTGRFDQISGTYTFNATHPQQDKVDITIPAASIDTNFPLRDEHLRSKEFFDVKSYPKITFVSTKYTPDGAHRGVLTGNLTLHGDTRPVTFRVREVGAGRVSYLPKPWGGYLSGFVATTTIHRSAFGMTAYLPEGLSNAIHIKVEVEGVKRN